MRSGYDDSGDLDHWELIKWRGVVSSAIRGKRGQAFLNEMLTALDALPEKRLIAEELEVTSGDVCAIGSVLRHRGVSMEGLNPEDHTTLADKCNIAYQLVQEIEFVNDDDYGYSKETPEQRWQRVRAWVVRQLDVKSEMG